MVSASNTNIANSIAVIPVGSGGTLVQTASIAVGGSGDDTFVATAVSDILDGAAGNDTVSYAPSTAGINVSLTTNVNTGGYAAGDSLLNIENVIGSSFDDVIAGSAVANTLSGAQGNDALYGNEGDDTLYGGAGIDLLIGGAGADMLDGGADNDGVDYIYSTEAVSVNLANNVNVGGDAQGDNLISIENVSGSNFDDTLVGSSGDNILNGGAGNDALYGGTGADLLIGGMGSDKLYGGSGADAAYYAASGTGVNVNLGITTAQSGGDAQGDTLFDIENLVGSNFNDMLTGNAGANTLNGGAGNDALYGGAGIDLLIGGLGADMLDGGADADTAYYADSAAGVNVNLVTNVHTGGDAAGDSLINIENLVGSNFNDNLVGSVGDNTLTGGAGDDTLYGGTGTDLLIGGMGSDKLYGGSGTDAAYYADSGAGVNVNLGITTAQSGGDAQGDTLFDIENLVGSNFSDMLTGNAAVNILNGGAGNDVLIGGLGADNLQGGAGVDTVSYVTSAAAVTVNLTTGVNTRADAEGDVLSGIENIVGSNFVDSLTGDAGVNNISGGGSDDLLIGGGGADVLDGGVGNDRVNYVSSLAGVNVNLGITTAQSGGDAQGDLLTSIEQAVGSNFNDTLTGTAGVNFLAGSAGNDTLNGLAGNDTLYGEAGNDTINGGDGDDLISGGAGMDVLDGGAGVDLAYYIASTSGINVNLSLTTAQSGGDAQGDIIRNIENVTGSNYNDTLMGNTGANSLYGSFGNDIISGLAGNDALYGEGDDDTLIGGAGADILDGGTGNDTVSYANAAAWVNVNLGLTTGQFDNDAQGDILVSIENIIGTDYNDVLNGNSGANTLIGGAGADFIAGNGGADIMDGGTGVDRVSYLTSNAAIAVNLGLSTAQSGGDAQGDILMNIEELVGTRFDDTIIGSAANNILFGGAGNDTVNGMAGNDTLYGEAGNDTINGGDGDDTLIGGLGADYVDGGAGSDTASYFTSTSGVTVNLATNANSGGDAAGDILTGIEHLTGSNYNDSLAGDMNINFIKGGLGDDSLFGMAGNDTLYGEAGNDVIVGGAGVDIMNGGAGNDIFRFTSLNDSLKTAYDSIFGFTQGQDKLDVASLGFTALDNSATPSAGHLGYYQSAGSTFVTDGHNFLVALSGTYTLTTDDLIHA